MWYTTIETRHAIERVEIEMRYVEHLDHMHVEVIEENEVACERKRLIEHSVAHIVESYVIESILP
jgi:hypothetical protein